MRDLVERLADPTSRKGALKALGEIREREDYGKLLEIRDLLEEDWLSYGLHLISERIEPDLILDTLEIRRHFQLLDEDRRFRMTTEAVFALFHGGSPDSPELVQRKQQAFFRFVTTDQDAAEPTSVTALRSELKNEPFARRDAKGVCEALTMFAAVCREHGLDAIRQLQNDFDEPFIRGCLQHVLDGLSGHDLIVEMEDEARRLLTERRRAYTERIDEIVLVMGRPEPERLQEIRQAVRTDKELLLDLERELQAAHDMQMGLMPSESPKVRGLQIASHCVPATHVGGDFFQYFQTGDKLSIATADVTGHAMAAAIPVVMFDGILDSQMAFGHELEDLFGRLNERLHSKMPIRSHVCFAMAQIDTQTRTVRFANAGCPYPVHFRASSDEIVELELSAYPLGVRADTKYTAIETELRTGDRLVFISDGIIEAQNQRGEMFGFERTNECIRSGCNEGVSANGLMDRLLSAVQEFGGGRPQEDDQTIVVVAVED